VEDENSTSGPQPYQPYEAEVTNSPISNSSVIFQQVMTSELCSTVTTLSRRFNSVFVSG
jgi:hypothetical protein